MFLRNKCSCIWNFFNITLVTGFETVSRIQSEVPKVLIYQAGILVLIEKIGLVVGFPGHGRGAGIK